MKSHQPDVTVRVLWAIMVVGVISVAATLFYLNGRPSAKGPLGCIDGVPGGRVAILVDKSDPFTAAQQDELRQHFEKIQDAFQVNDLVSIYLLNDADSANKKPTFARCMPPKTANSLYAAKAKTKKKFHEEFGSKYAEIVEGAVAPAEAEKSPILEMVRRISRSSYFNDEPGKIRKLYVVSDMMQNVSGTSFFTQSVRFEDFSSSGYGKKILEDANLKGVDVTLIVIPRQETPFERMQEVKRFWIDYLRHQGAQNVKVSTLP